MFNSLKDKITALFSGNNSTAEKLILEVFTPVTELDANLPKRILNYIMQGDDASVLVDINNLVGTKVYLQLAAPGVISSHYYYNKNDKITQKSVKARMEFYKQWIETYTQEQIIRFGKVLAAMHDGNFFSVITSKLPLWFLYLLCDGLITTLKDVEDSKFIMYRPNWSAQQLYQLLETEGAGLGDQLLFAIFDRQNVDEYYLRNFKHIFSLPDLLPYITHHVELFKQLPTQKLSAIGQLEQLEYIEKQPVLKAQLMAFITRQSVSDSKKVSELATTMLMSAPVEQVLSPLEDLLKNGTPKQRSKAAMLLARLSADRKVLEQALTDETNKTVIQSIEAALSRLDSTEVAQHQESELIIPSVEPIIDTPLPVTAREILQKNYQEQLDKYEKNAKQEIENNKNDKESAHWYQDNYKKLKSITSADLDNIYHYLNGSEKLSKSLKQKHIYQYTGFILAKKRLQALPNFNLFHLLRAHKIINFNCNTYQLAALFEENELMLQADLRQIDEILIKIGYFDNPKREITRLFLRRYGNIDNESYEAEPSKLWPFFAENLEFIDEALGLLPSQEKNDYYSFQTGFAIDILRLFPQLPAKYVSYLLEFALGEGKALRFQAQDALSNIADIHSRAEEALTSSKQDVRIVAAQWLARLGQKSSIKLLNDALKKEKKETVQAALLTALEALGDDISIHLAPKKLLVDAEKGLKGKKTAGFEWFDETQIPNLTWQNGKSVDPKIIQWWCWLAVKLKDPSNSLLVLYTRLLSSSSQHQLGQFILQSFIVQDTLSPTLAEAEEEANLYADRRWKQYQASFKRNPEFYAKYEHITLEEVTEEIKREVLKRYIGSAISSKGLLALSSSIEGHVAVSMLRNYMKDHYTRRFQIEAMLESIANSNDPMIIQLLLSIARRHRTNSVQEKAKFLINDIAERNQWTTDELADRTISTASLDESGVLSLDYGERIFTAILDAKFKFVLKNPDGKEIKALPEPRKTEDETLVKEAKKQFSSSKKELKQVLDLQIARLYEAMCSERRWTVSDWKKYLQAHPIMNQLIQRLIWLEIDTDGQIVNSFRPTEDGSLINLDDDELTLNEKHFIILAHAALLPEEFIKKWQAHLKDYKVTPLFNQLVNTLPNISHVKDGVIEDRKGWMTDTFTLRGILTKLGYKRADIEDGGCFGGYYKHFSSLNLYINIEFSGSYVPEENIPAVLYNVYFSSKQGWNTKAIDINNVPSVLLAEGYADYMAVANACSGFDPEWEKKGLW